MRKRGVTELGGSSDATPKKVKLWDKAKEPVSNLLTKINKGKEV